MVTADLLEYSVVISADVSADLQVCTVTAVQQSNIGCCAVGVVLLQDSCEGQMQQLLWEGS